MKADNNLFHHPLYFIIFFFFFFFISLSSQFQASTAADNGGLLIKDSQQLISFKNSLSNPDELITWQPTISPCNFHGVSCKNSRVSSIDLSNSHLNTDLSTVATFLLSLQNLESLVLKNTNISGPISSVSRFSCNSFLNSLDLSENYISGPITDIPALRVCSNLVSLNLSKNSMDPFVKGVARGYGLSSLRVLDLSYNNISGENGVSWLLSTSFAELQYLSLKGNKVTGGLVEFNFKNLEYLDLSINNISSNFPVFSDCSSLQHLDLSSNKFFGNVENSLSTCGKLSFVNLTNNHLTGSVPNLPSTLPESLAACSGLELLDISANNFSGELPVDIFLKLSNLKTLVLSFNNFVGGLPDSLSKLVSLETLDVSSNNLSGLVPAGLCQDPRNSFKVLYLQNNMFTGPIPESWSNCSHLESLDLSFNYLTGTIPPSLGFLKNLRDIIMWLNQLHGEIPQEFMYLQSLENLILDFNDLSGSIPASLSNCSNLNWISLSNNQFSGEIPASLGQLANLAILKLGNNSLSGSIPSELGDCRSLLWLDLNTNFLNGRSRLLDGSIPKELGSMFYLSILNMGHNDLSGPIPQELGGLKSVAILDLSYNRLNGTIPQSLTSLTLLGDIDLSNNNLSGLIPESAPFDTFPDYRFANNSGLCGYPLPSCGSGLGSGSGQHPKSRRKQASLAGSVAMGLLFSLFCIFGLILVAVETKKRRKKKEAALEAYMENHSNSATAHSNWKLSAREALSINLATFEKPLRKLTFADLLEATNGFHNDTLIGSGGFGDVYRAQLKDGSVVAIKKLIHVSGQGDREFTAEMETIGKIKHRNLVPLLGYCKVGEERLLVYEYMKYGSLEDVLHDRKKIGIKLNWFARRKIAIGAARGLAFLHHNCIPHIIHRDMKSSNVLLDENLEARVSDFGMARLMSAMDTHLSVSTLAGTPGYVPPEYYQSFRCSTKGDVYSYGVVLLELLTGRQPTDSADFGDNNLVGWVKQHAKMRISDVFDPELIKEDPSLEIELLQHLKVACGVFGRSALETSDYDSSHGDVQRDSGGIGIDSASSIAIDDGGFSAVEGVEMSIKEGNELSKHL
ncbi:hypothetical protein DH2020_040522 [Rehmannia glutinosa]|uniref:Protein kinase domain-containing protein n=1 Tax=Rehmannia glutinosa TaxID=99300 RepID=A0ABR0UU07_REHGL